MKKFFTIISFSASVFANDYEAGKKKSFICAECHGETGISLLSNYPNLSGQKFDYLVSALKAYQNGLRKNDTMQAMVTNLSEQDIHNLATYYSQQSCRD